MNVEYKKVAKFVNGVPHGIDICNTGSTFAQFGFDYSYFKGKVGFNFALQPQSFNYDFKILKQFANHIKQGAIVIITTAIFQFCVTDYPRDRYNYKYYHFLNKNFINDYRDWKYFLIDKLGVYPSPLHMATTARNTLRSLTGDFFKDTEVTNKRIRRWQTEFGVEDTTTAMPSAILKSRFEKTTRTLVDILSLCKERNFRPIIISMPAVKEESEAFSPAFLQAYYFDNVARGNIINAPFINFFQDDRFHNPQLYENGADCLNDEGRKYFADILLHELKKLGMWE